MYRGEAAKSGDWIMDRPWSPQRLFLLGHLGRQQLQRSGSPLTNLVLFVVEGLFEGVDDARLRNAYAAQGVGGLFPHAGALGMFEHLDEGRNRFFGQGPDLVERVD